MPEDKSVPPNNLRYRQVRLDALHKDRRGEHHDLVVGIFKQLEALSPHSAIEIPLKDLGGIGLNNLRSAVHRACIKRGVQVGTLADERNFYVWKKK